MWKWSMPFYQTSMKEKKKKKKILHLYFYPPYVLILTFFLSVKEHSKSQNTSVLYIPETFSVEYTIWMMNCVIQCNILSNLFLINY